MAPQKNRVDPRVVRTHKLLLDAFMGLLAEKDLEDITVQDIAARATVNRATFYDHFVDKYAMVEEISREGFSHMLRQRERPNSLGIEADLRHLFLAVCDYVQFLQSHCKHGQVFDSLAEAQIKARLREQVRLALSEEWAPQAHSQPKRELLITMVSWSIYGAAMEWSQRSGHQPTEAFVDEALPLVLASVATFGKTTSHSF